MYDYRRMMEQVTLSDRKKEEIMNMLENKDTQKRRMPRAGKLILAAALAVGCVLSIAAGLPAQVYNFVAGGVMTVLPGTDQAFFDFTGEDTSPIALKDGRVLLAVDGQEFGDTCAIGGDNFALPGSISLDDFKDIQPAEDGSFVVGGEFEMVDYPVYRPWLDAALKQLGLDVEMGLAD